MGKSIMLQGTASGSGKSILAAGLCRIFKQDGFRVFPFKSQNIQLHSYVTLGGQEISETQAYQAEAAGLIPEGRMNPIVLRPTSERKSQVFFYGEDLGNLDARDYHQLKPQLSQRLKKLFAEISAENDLVVIEGSGSPAEINLYSRDIANMGMAKIADAPVLLVADIDKGGVFASIYGTIELIGEIDRQRIKGIIINKFRGDVSLLDPGLKMIEDLTGVPVVGVVPYAQLDIESNELDNVKINRTHNQDKALDIAVLNLSKISNFSDFQSLQLEEDVSLRYIFPGDAIGTPDILIITGSKNLFADRLLISSSGLEEQIIRLRNSGKTIVGLGSGYYLLGNTIANKEMNTFTLGSVSGLGLLNIESKIEGASAGSQIVGVSDDLVIKGYQLPLGHVENNEQQYFALLQKDTETDEINIDGAVSSDGKVFGTTILGVFDNSQWRRQFLNKVRQDKGLPEIKEVTTSMEDLKNSRYDRLADLLRDSLDLERIYAIINSWHNQSEF